MDVAFRCEVRETYERDLQKRQCQRTQKIELETPVDDPRRWFRELTLSLTQNTGPLGFAVVSRSHKTRAQVDGNAS